MKSSTLLSQDLAYDTQSLKLHIPLTFLSIISLRFHLKRMTYFACSLAVIYSAIYVLFGLSWERRLNVDRDCLSTLIACKIEMNETSERDEKHCRLSR